MSPFLGKCLPHLRKPYESFTWLHCPPYCWADEGPTTIKTRWARVHWRVNVSLLIAYFCFVLIRAGQVFSDPCGSVGAKIYMVVVTVAYSAPLVFAFNIASTRADFISFLKGYIRFLQEREPRQEAAVGEEIQRLGKLCKLLMIALDGMTKTAPVAVAGLNIAHPTSPEFLSSLLDMQEGHWLYCCCGILASTIFQYYLWICYARMTLIIFGVIYLFICSMPVFLIELRVEKEMLTARERSAALEKKLGSYRCAELHTINFNQIYNLFNAYAHPACMAVATCSIYGAVRASGVIAAVAANWAFMGLAICLPWVGSYAKINDESRAALESLRRVWSRDVQRAGQIGRKIIGRKVRNMRELRISTAGSRYYYDKALVLTTVEIILGQSVDLLVMY